MSAHLCILINVVLSITVFLVRSRLLKNNLVHHQCRPTCLLTVSRAILCFVCALLFAMFAHVVS